MGQARYCQNRPGADGIIAVTAALNSSDGHTLLYANGGPVTSNLLSHAGSLPYNPDDLLPIAAAAEVYVAIGVPASLAINSLSDFVAQARSKQGQFNWSGTAGSLDYLVPGFLKRADIDLTRVPYREVSLAMQDLSQNRLQLYVAALATQLPMAQSGKIKIVAVTSSQRSPSLPDVPTASEAGFADLAYEAFLGFFAPRGMSASLRERISADLQAVAADETSLRFNPIGMRVRVTLRQGWKNWSRTNVPRLPVSQNPHRGNRHANTANGKHINMTGEHPQANLLLQIGGAYRQAKVLLSAVELGVFSALAAGPLDASDLADRTQVHSRAARDFFDALVAMGVLTRDDKGQYCNTEESDHYLDQAKPSYLGASFDQYNRREYALWGSLTRSLQTGDPAAETQGQDHFESLYSDAARFRTFVTAMTSGSLLAARGIAQQFPWENYETLCDIGTAQGCLPVQVALANPHVRAVGFDLPALRPAFEAYAVECNVADRLSFVEGDFFRDPLPQADVIVLGRVLHNWDLATKKMLLAKAYQAIQTHGAWSSMTCSLTTTARTTVQACFLP